MVTFFEGKVAQFGVEEAGAPSLVEHEWTETVVWVY